MPWITVNGAHVLIGEAGAASGVGRIQKHTAARKELAKKFVRARHKRDRAYAFEKQLQKEGRAGFPSSSQQRLRYAKEDYENAIEKIKQPKTHKRTHLKF
jgi:hypothetical protein